MDSRKNIKGYLSVPILYGNTAQIIPIEERQSQELLYKWNLYIKAPKGFIKSATFKLHESFLNPTLIVDKEPFVIEQSGWGEFTIQIKIVLFNNDRVAFSHFLKLHGEGAIVISEKRDVIFYRGSTKFNIPGELLIKEDADEFERINKAIEKTLEELKKSNI